jgi:Rod binding domain-containing protein
MRIGESTPAPPAVPDRNKLLEQARKLEATLVRDMFVAMERAQLEQGFFGRGPATQGLEATFEHFLGDLLGHDRGLGLAEQMVDRWLAEPERLDSGSGTSKFFQRVAQVERLAADKTAATHQADSLLGALRNRR